MSQRSTGPACGNNPHHQPTDGDHQAVEDFKAYLADRTALRDRIAAVMKEAYLDNAVDLGQLTPKQQIAALANAVLPPPADRAAVYAEVAERLAADAEQGDKEGLTRIYRRSAAKQVREWAAKLRCTADETPDAEQLTVLHAIPLPGSNGISACCGRPPCEFVGERVTRDPDKVTCPGPASGARQDDVWPVKESTRRYAEELRSSPSTVVADGHTGWECNAGAQLLVDAEAPRPGRVATHHGVIYSCAGHQTAAVDRITNAGFQADPRPAPPGHRWNPWPCGHVTAYGTQALTTLTTAGARQDVAPADDPDRRNAAALHFLGKPIPTEGQEGAQP